MSDLDPKVKPFLIQRADEIVQRRGIQALIDYNFEPELCGCMGPRGGEPMCNCRMQMALNDHLPEILNEFHPDAALALIRKRLIGALGGGI